ncbi:uncharacterized protein LOC119101648 isoform X2 [Pollicipes pollicipes]|uniref:uncharacterized protein LOC119101648 isoform X2 n=1 Tax=Pollicipes pollicipes TaxID=41117 RepID=UPI0018858B5F|nr:uncharacterized protein LOC119101648 isoform X2 [Pollicipes pollicipes]
MASPKRSSSSPRDREKSTTVEHHVTFRDGWVQDDLEASEAAVESSAIEKDFAFEDLCRQDLDYLADVQIEEDVLDTLVTDKLAGEPPLGRLYHSTPDLYGGHPRAPHRSEVTLSPPFAFRTAGGGELTMRPLRHWRSARELTPEQHGEA